MENMLLRVIPRRRFPILIRYAASACIVGVAAMLRFAVGAPLDHYPLLLFFPAVFLCALLFDKGSGFFATILSGLVAAYLFIGERGSFMIAAHDTLPLAIFVLIGFTMAGVTEALRKTVARLAEAERAKGLLLEELGHRIKNDLAIISSTIRLQAQASDLPAVRQALEDANARLLVVSSVQDRLRGDPNGGSVELANYIEGLCSGLGDVLRGLRPIAVRVDCDTARVDSTTAVSVGLIVNELVTNSLKYAFPDGRGGTIEVSVHSQGERITIQVADDGAGCPTDAKDGSGSRLVRLLARQYRGSVARSHSSPGCRVVVELTAKILHPALPA